MAKKKEEIISNEEEIKTAVEETAVSLDEKVEEVKSEDINEEKETSEKQENEEVEKKEDEKTSSEEVKLKVVEVFTDKYTDERYELNDVLTVDKKRAEELLKNKRKLVIKIN